MRILPIAAALALLAGQAQANDVFGVWKTATNDEGKYLHVEVHACKEDGAKVCGTIVGAFGGADETTVGKWIIRGMQADGPGAWGDGEIWKADEDEVYDSEMALAGGDLKVSGCILFGQVCKSQTWTPVK